MNKVLVVLCGILAWCAVGRGEGEETPGTVRAARLEVVDSGGLPRAVIGTAEGGLVFLHLLDGSGRTAVGILVTDDGVAHLALESGKGGNGLLLSCDEQMASLQVGVIGASTSIQSSREVGQVLTMWEGSVPRITLRAPSAEPAGSGRAGLSICDAEGEQVFGAPR